MNPFPLPWTRLVSLLSFDGACRSDADGLIALYEKDRCWKKTLSELLGLSLESVALFYAHLEQSGSSGSLSRAAWPHSFSFMNVRALGREGEPGTFLDAAKVVPSLRTSCVHLGPFTAYEHRCIYAVASVRSISSRVTDLELERKGFTREWQLAALVAACRLLGKSAAYDIEPHVTQFAIPVLEHPEAFRWIRLDAGKKALSHPSSEILRDDVQACIVDEVRTTVVPMMRAAGETSLEYANEDERLRREPLHHAIIGGLIEQGLWTVPSQIWAGDGVPEFNYMHADGYPVFSCRDRKGKDRRDEALNVVTPFRFDREHSLFDDIFPYWRDRFGFRVVRFDSVDHIFDSCDGFDSPRSDRPAPSHLARCISHAASRTLHRPREGQRRSCFRACRAHGGGNMRNTRRAASTRCSAAICSAASERNSPKRRSRSLPGSRSSMRALRRLSACASPSIRMTPAIRICSARPSSKRSPRQSSCSVIFSRASPHVGRACARNTRSSAALTAASDSSVRMFPKRT